MNTRLTRDCPRIGEAYCGFDDPAAAVADWRNRWRLERQNLLRSEQQARQAQATGAARERLDRFAEACSAQRTSIERILAPLLGNDRGGARETLIGLKTRLPSHHAPSSYAANICRDWVWGQQETRQALEILMQLHPIRGSVLVLGSGAGGLAHALAEHADEVVALDSNPLLSLIASEMNGGKPQPFVEFPLNPRGDVAVAHRLEPGIRRSNLIHVWADALRAPFDDNAFDVVITHWLIDVIDATPGTLAAHVNKLLKPGGSWLNQGSFAFAHSNPADNPTLPEVLEMLSQQGFGEVQQRDDECPYLASPNSRQRRTETLLSWRADKIGEASVAEVAHRPVWLTSANAPVPLNESFQTQAAATRIHAFVVSLIDGRRSITGMARELERQGLMPQHEAVEAIRGMLDTMWEESRR